MEQNTGLKLAIRRVFRPISRLSMARGLLFQDVQKLLKQAFVDTAERDFQINGKRLTESRISLLTGLQRRDIKQILESEALPSPKPYPLQRLHSQLLLLDQAKLSIDEFEELARSLYQDIHPRTFLDELVRLELLIVEGDDIQIASRAMISDDNDEALAIFADNISAHSRSSVSNLLGEPAELEQAVYATNLTKDDAALLQRIARERAMELLIELNKKATAMQHEKKGNLEVRIGIYFNQKETD